MTELNTGTKSVAEAASQSIQSRATDRSDTGIGGVGGIFQYLFRGGELVSPWWSTQRDVDLLNFVKSSDHLNGVMALLTAKVVNIPVQVQPRDLSLRTHMKQADEFNRRLAEESEFGQGWITLASKFLENYWGTDNGGFFEVIGPGNPDGPIKGAAVGLAALDSTRIIRKKDQEYPIAYIDEDGHQYRLHYTRVAYASEQPSAILEMRNVGFCAVSRAIGVTQNLVDIATFKQEKLGSRQPRGVLFTPGIPTDVVQATLNMASEMMDNQSLRRFARIPILGGDDTAATFQLIDLVSLPDGFDEETSTRLGMFAIALAFGVPIRWIWPAATSGATKADAMYQHIAGLGGGIGRVLKTLSLILGGDPVGPRHSTGKFLPPHLKLVFDFQDDEQDRMKAEIRKMRLDVIATSLETGVTTLRVAREQMLESGDVSEAQFNQMELADGRLPSGEDVMTLFYAKENDLLDLGVDDPLDVERNDREEMIEAIEDRMAEVRKGMPSVGSAKQKEARKQALAALGKLREAYEKVQSAQQQATDAETEEQAEGKDQPDKIEEEEAQEKVETQPPKQVENEEIIEEMNEEARKDSLLTNLYNGLKGLADTIKSRKKVWPPEDEEEKGGPGSGHHGHEGRPGQRGGSSPGLSLSIIEGSPNPEVHKIIESTIARIGQRYPSVTEQIQGIEYSGHGLMEWHSDREVLTMGAHLSTLDLADVDRVVNSWADEFGMLGGGLETTIYHEVGHIITTNIRDTLLARGNTEANDRFHDRLESLRSSLGYPSEYSRRGIGEWTAERFALELMGDAESNVMGVLEEWAERVGERSKNVTGVIQSWDSKDRSVIPHPLSSLKSLATAIKQATDEERHRVKGGPGSGHHGHSGRPGEVGGSTAGVPIQSEPGGRSPAGGMIGINGMFYPGGTFLPSTRLAKQPPPSQRERKPRKLPISPGEWEQQPTPTAASIFETLAGTYAQYDRESGRLARFEPFLSSQFGAGADPEVMKRGLVYGRLSSLLEAFNEGIRWVEPADESESELLVQDQKNSIGVINHILSSLKSLSTAIKQTAGAERYRKDIWGAVQNLWNASISRADFIGVMNQLVPIAFEYAWLEAVKEEGITSIEELEEEERAALRRRTSSELTFVDRFADYIIAHSKAEGFKLRSLAPRVNMWVGRYMDIYNQARQAAGGVRKYRWRMTAKENCWSCLKLNGQVRRMSAWKKFECRPQHPDLECMHSANGPTVCKCGFEETDEPSSRGPLPRWRAV